MTQNQIESNTKGKNSNKVRIILVCIFLLIVIGGTVVVLKSCASEDDKVSYKGYYKSGQDYLAEQKYEKALTEFLKAKKYIKTAEEDISLKIVLWEAYSHLPGKDVESIELLKELIALKPDSVEYYDSLIAIYKDTSRTDDLKQLLADLKGTIIENQLAYYKIDPPIPDVEEGEYKKFFSVKLSSEEENAVIYYKLLKEEELDDQIISTMETFTVDQIKENFKKYKKAISLSDEGHYTLLAISISGRGIPGHIMRKDYYLELDVIAGPKVTPESGDFSESTKIEVEVPENAKAYYNFESGVTPNEKSEEYTKPINMPRGNHFFNVIIIKDNGKKSEVVTKIYNLNIPQNVDYDTALTTLKKYLVVIEEMEDTSGKCKDKGKITFAYEDTIVLYNEKTVVGEETETEEHEYYLIHAIKTDKSGKQESDTLYGLDTGDGSIAKIKKDKKGNYSITNK